MKKQFIFILLLIFFICFTNCEPEENIKFFPPEELTELSLDNISNFWTNDTINNIEKILLSKNEIPGYELKNESKIHWVVSNDNKVHYGIGQQWKIMGAEGEQYVYINYCEFHSIQETILSTAFSAQSNVAFYIWGSPTGSIIGEGTWTVIGGTLNNSDAIYFSRGNIGIKLFFPFYQNRDLNQRMESISNKLIEKINRNLPDEILSTEKRMLSESGTIKLYESAFNSINDHIQELTLNNSNLSNWIIENVKYYVGMRKEWNNDANTIGIDLCKFNTSSEAKLAAEIKSKISSISHRVFDLDGQNLLMQVKSEWDYYFNSKISSNTFSLIGTKDNTAIHIYCFNTGDINFNIIYSIVNEIDTIGN